MGRTNTWCGLSAREQPRSPNQTGQSARKESTMSNTFKHVEDAKLRKEQRGNPQEHYYQPSIKNQAQPYYGPKRASDIKIDLYS